MTPLPKTRDPLASMNESHKLIKLLCFEDAMQTCHAVMPFSLTKNSQSYNLQAVLLRNARVEESFIYSVAEYLSGF